MQAMMEGRYGGRYKATGLSTKAQVVPILSSNRDMEEGPFASHLTFSCLGQGVATISGRAIDVVSSSPHGCTLVIRRFPPRGSDFAPARTSASANLTASCQNPWTVCRTPCCKRVIAFRGNKVDLARAHIPQPSFYLIRPDGYVGLCGTRLEAAELRAYVSQNLYLNLRCEHTTSRRNGPPRVVSNWGDLSVRARCRSGYFEDATVCEGEGSAGFFTRRNPR
jgi:hypothetical protein